jgi:hypothetical protein
MTTKIVLSELDQGNYTEVSLEAGSGELVIRQGDEAIAVSLRDAWRLRSAIGWLVENRDCEAPW